MESEEIKPFKWTSDYILDQLEKGYPPNEYAFFRELRIGTGYGKDSESRLDAYSIHYMKGKRNVTTCFEIKISKSDFLHEIKKPKKRRPGLRLSHQFYFVTPENLVKIEEVPVECGLIFVTESGELKTIIKAPYRESMPTWQFMATVCRRFDSVRRKEWEYDEKLKAAIYEREAVTRSCLERHLKKWQDWKIGSREVPDKILDALEDLRDEVEAALASNRRYR